MPQQSGISRECHKAEATSSEQCLGHEWSIATRGLAEPSRVSYLPPSQRLDGSKGVNMSMVRAAMLETREDAVRGFVRSRWNGETGHESNEVSFYVGSMGQRCQMSVESRGL